jgi:hypothetical protein
LTNASTYLSKYLIKEYNSEGSDISFYNKYKSYFSKFKFFRTSNFYHTTQKKVDLIYQYLCKNYPDILELIKSTTIPLYEVLEQFEIQGVFEFEKEKIGSISFNRRVIKEFYDTYSKNSAIQDYQIKDEIIENIDYFSDTVTLSRIKTATFNYDHDLIVQILKSYDIETKGLMEEENIPPDKFYEVGMYEMKEYKLYYSLILGESIV